MNFRNAALKKIISHFIPLSLLFFASLNLTACSYNPFASNNHLTGSVGGGLLGASVAGGSVALLGGSRPMMFLAGIAGGATGYYVTTLRYQASGIYYNGGQVYQVGDYVGLYIPTDKLFEPNTDRFLPDANILLDNAVTIVSRYPKNKIIISCSTSGVGAQKREVPLSQRRAERILAYFWKAGVHTDIDHRFHILAVGYGDKFPIAHTYTNDSLRQNSRIQILSYPLNGPPPCGKTCQAFNNIGALTESRKPKPCELKGECNRHY